ncbi:MAG: hypothetical protein ABFE01_22045 [Phycisphaerales bacterium]
MAEMLLPKDKKFAFTIVDDTDDAFLENIRPIYDFLTDRRVFITKTVWVYPPRDAESKGDSLQNVEYLKYVRELKRRGFEIALHNVGSGSYARAEILAGLETFRELLGEYPKIHINHSYNQDNIYSGDKRFGFPFNRVLRVLYPKYRDFSGEEENSPHFWGDVHKQIIRFNRNYEFDEINLLKINPEAPYRDRRYRQYSNYWFSAAFAPNPWCFNHLVTRRSIDRLEREGGICIVYTHLGYYMRTGVVDQGFVNRIRYLASKGTGLFIPVSQLLDHILKARGCDQYLDPVRRFKLEFLHLLTRAKYRYINRIDDRAFKRAYP